MIRNVCDAVDPPKVEKREIQPLTVEQSQKLLAAVRGDRMEAVYVLALTAGLRQGAGYALGSGIQLARSNLTFELCTRRRRYGGDDVSGPVSCAGVPDELPTENSQI